MNIMLTEYHDFDSTIKVGSHHYAVELAKENDVYWITQPRTLFHFLQKNPSVRNKNIARIKTWIKGHQNFGRIKMFCPFGLFPYSNHFPFNNYAFAIKSVKLSRLSLFNSYNKLLPIDILWIHHPRMMYLAKHISAGLKIYRYNDNQQAFEPDLDIRRLENELIPLVDIVLVTSLLALDELKARFSKCTEKFFYLPNGVELDTFQKPSSNKPVEYNDSTKKIAVYVGAIHEWFDFKTLNTAASATFNEWNFYIIGNKPATSIIEDSPKNIYFLGPRNHNQIPTYLSHANVGIIPFLENDVVDYINPIKMYEYSAAGLPTISFGWKELLRLNSPSIHYKTTEEFISILKNFNNNDCISKDELILFAMENSWRNRFKKLNDLISANIK